jgi:hypothetical protein
MLTCVVCYYIKKGITHSEDLDMRALTGVFGQSALLSTDIHCILHTQSVLMSLLCCLHIILVI